MADRDSGMALLEMPQSARPRHGAGRGRGDAEFTQSDADCGQTVEMGRDWQTRTPRPRRARGEDRVPARGAAGIGWTRHVAVLAAALVLVAGFLVTVGRTVAADSWLYQFFLNRSFVQYVTLYVFVYGLGLIVLRSARHADERRALKTLSSRSYRPDGTGVVAQRLARFRDHLSHFGFGKAHEYAKTLSEEDAARLDGDYSTVGDIIQVLPMLGFFGTVYGLAVGLYQQFISGQASGDTGLFAKALATAFDTTLLGLACALIVMALQRPLRKREENLLSELDIAVEEYLCLVNHDESADLTLTKAVGSLQDTVDKVADRADEILKSTCDTIVNQMAEQRAALQEVASRFGGLAGIFGDELSRRLGESSHAAAAAAREEIAAGAGQAIHAFRAELVAAARGTLSELREQSQAHARELVSGVVSALGGAVTESARQQEARSAETNALLREEIALLRQLAGGLGEFDRRTAASTADVTGRISTMATRIEEAFSRPRRISIVESVLSEEGGNNGRGKAQ